MNIARDNLPPAEFYTNLSAGLLANGLPVRSPGEQSSGKLPAASLEWVGLAADGFHVWLLQVHVGLALDRNIESYSSQIAAHLYRILFSQADDEYFTQQPDATPIEVPAVQEGPARRKLTRIKNNDRMIVLSIQIPLAEALL